MSPIEIKNTKVSGDLDYALNLVWPTLEANQNGSTTFRNIDGFEALLAVICGLINVPDYWHPDEKAGVIRRALLEANRGGKPKADQFIDFVRKAARTLLKAAPNEFCCWSKISIAGASKKKFYRFKIGEFTIELRPRIPKAMELSEYFISGIGHISPDEPEGGAYLIARGKFISETQAGSSLSTALHDFSGLLTYAQIRYRREFQSGKRRPKSKVSLGEQFFLFEGSRHVTADKIWYDGDYREKFWRSSRYEWKTLSNDEQFIRFFIKSVERSASREFIWSSFRVASRAWMTHDIDDRLSQLWTAFEILFSRSRIKNDSFDKVIDRASFFAKDRRLARLVLTRVAEARNHYFHRRASGPAVSHLADWMSNFYAGVIEWIAFSRMSFESHDRLLDMTELTTNEESLDRQISDRRRALKVVRRG